MRCKPMHYNPDTSNNYAHLALELSKALVSLHAAGVKSHARDKSQLQVRQGAACTQTSTRGEAQAGKGA